MKLVKRSAKAALMLWDDALASLPECYAGRLLEK